VRIETEAVSGGNILEGDLLLEVILSSTSELQKFFPFDIVNLDFSSQELDGHNNRLERELSFLEKFLFLQNENDIKKLVLIYTSLFNSDSINKNTIVSLSDQIQVDGWQGLDLSNFLPVISGIIDLKTFINRTLQLFCQKHGYSRIKTSDLTLNCSSSTKLYSLALIVER